MKLLQKYFLLAAIIATCLPSQAQNVIGYSPYYRNYSANFDFGHFTHVHFLAIWADASGNLVCPTN